MNEMGASKELRTEATQQAVGYDGQAACLKGLRY